MLFTCPIYTLVVFLPIFHQSHIEISLGPFAALGDLLFVDALSMSIVFTSVNNAGARGLT